MPEGVYGTGRYVTIDEGGGQTSRIWIETAPTNVGQPIVVQAPAEHPVKTVTVPPGTAADADLEQRSREEADQRQRQEAVRAAAEDAEEAKRLSNAAPTSSQAPDADTATVADIASGAAGAVRETRIEQAKVSDLSESDLEGRLESVVQAVEAT